MLRCFLFLLCFFISSCRLTQVPSNSHSSNIDWQEWSTEIFQDAKQQNRLVILDLKSNWCHWCHVMEQTTYEDNEVAKTIDNYYIAVRVDQDSHPALANRYRQYGWPATIIFTADGKEIFKNRGYIPPQKMRTLLHKLHLNPQQQNNPSQISYATNHTLSKKIRSVLKNKYRKTYDEKFAGLKLAKKFLDWDTIEYALIRAQTKDAFSEKLARTTLDNAMNLFDPVWGGMYQYSTHGDWQHPHYEKIMATQVRAIKSYVLAYRVFREPKYLRTAKNTCDYLQQFLMSQQGVFYTSQDADVVPGQKSDAYFALSDVKRREQGIPRVDTNIYSRENGWAIEAFAIMYAITNDKKYLAVAEKAAKWFLENRKQGSGFTHGENGKIFLSGNIALAKSFLQLHEVTANKKWLQEAKQTLQFIDKNFRNLAGGFCGEIQQRNSVLQPVNDIEENISITRCSNKVYHYSGSEQYLQVAQHAMKYLATESILEKRITEPAILLADEELGSEPIHTTVVGIDKNAEQLFLTAQKLVSYNKIVEWLKTEENATNNAGITFPQLPFSAAFLCTDSSCSAPISEKNELESLLLEQALLEK